VCAILPARSISATGQCAISAEIALFNEVPSLPTPVIKIDYYGELLIGCIDCNPWGRPGDKNTGHEIAGR
jgi:hypothetical protein